MTKTLVKYLTDSIAMQHNVDYSVCKDNKKCENEVDRKLSKLLMQFLIMKEVGTFLGTKHDKHKTESLSQCFKKRKKPSSKEIRWQQQLSEELHKPMSRDFTRRRVIVNQIDEIWSADLVTIQNYLLTVIDVFSKYGWIKKKGG